MKFWKLLFRFHEGAPMAKFDFKGGVSADAKVSGVSQNTPARIGGPTGPNTFPPPPPPPPVDAVPLFLHSGSNGGDVYCFLSEGVTKSGTPNWVVHVGGNDYTPSAIQSHPDPKIVFVRFSGATIVAGATITVGADDPALVTAEGKHVAPGDYAIVV